MQYRVPEEIGRGSVPGEVDALILQAASEQLGGAQTGLFDALDQFTEALKPKRAQADHVGHVVGLRDARGGGIQQRRVREAVLYVLDCYPRHRGLATLWGDEVLHRRAHFTNVPVAKFLARKKESEDMAYSLLKENTQTVSVNAHNNACVRTSSRYRPRLACICMVQSTEAHLCFMALV